VAVNTDCATYLNERREVLHQQLLRVDSLAEKGTLPEARLENDRLHFTALARSVPETAEEWTERAYDLLPRIKLTDLLTEVDGWTRFTACFTHLHNNESAKDKAVLLSAVLADATKPGPDLQSALLDCRLAHSRGNVFEGASRDYQRTSQTTVCPALGRRNDILVGWAGFPDFDSASGDSHHQPKYGRDPTVTFYTHVSDQYGPFHTKVINSTLRDALHVLDGLLGHDPDLRIKEHYTDTAGFTDQVFGTCHMLGFRFAPRIRDLGDHKIYPSPNQGNIPRCSR
jgi:Tn3 transposase DDE domain